MSKWAWFHQTSAIIWKRDFATHTIEKSKRTIQTQTAVRWKARVRESTFTAETCKHRRHVTVFSYDHTFDHPKQDVQCTLILLQFTMTWKIGEAVLQQCNWWRGTLWILPRWFCVKCSHWHAYTPTTFCTVCRPAASSCECRWVQRRFCFMRYIFFTAERRFSRMLKCPIPFPAPESHIQHKNDLY